MLGYFVAGDDFEREGSLEENIARTLPWEARLGRVGVSKMGPRLIVGVFCPAVEVAGTNVPPELSVRRRFCEAWITLRMGDDAGGGMEDPEAERLWIKSVRAAMFCLLMGEDIWRSPPRDDGGVGPPNISSPRTNFL